MKTAIITISLIVILGTINASEAKPMQDFLAEDKALHHFNQGQVLRCIDNYDREVIITNSLFKQLNFMNMIMFTDVQNTFRAIKCVLVAK